MINSQKRTFFADFFREFVNILTRNECENAHGMPWVSFGVVHFHILKQKLNEVETLKSYDLCSISILKWEGGGGNGAISWMGFF